MFTANANYVSDATHLTLALDVTPTSVWSINTGQFFFNYSADIFLGEKITDPFLDFPVVALGTYDTEPVSVTLNLEPSTAPAGNSVYIGVATPEPTTLPVVGGLLLVGSVSVYRKKRGIVNVCNFGGEVARAA